MHLPRINRTTVKNIVQPDAVASTSTAANLHQRSEPPTQRAGHSLDSVGKRMLKSVGKLFQKSAEPRQAAAKVPSAKTAKTSQPMSDEQAAQQAARNTRLPGSRLQGADDLRQSMVRPGSDEAASSGTQHPASTRPVPVPAGSLPRSRAGRFDLQDGRLERTEASLPTPRTSLDSRVQAPNTERQTLQSLMLQSLMLAESLEAESRANRAHGAPPEADPQAAPPASLSRSNAGRFNVQHGHLERGALSPNTLALSTDGRPDFSSFSPPGMPQLLESVLARPGQTYLAQHSQPEQHLLLESSGHLLHLTQNAMSLSFLRNSKPLPDVQGSKQQTVKVEREGGQAHIDKPGMPRTTLQLPGNAHLAHITGVHQAPNGPPLRVHEGRLYQFSQASGRWQATEHPEDIAFNGLVTGGNGTIYAKSDNALIDLSSTVKPHLEVTDLQSFSVASDHVAALLLEDSQNVMLVDMAPGPEWPRRAKKLELELDGGQAKAAVVGLSATRLFVADTQGRLYSAERSAFDNDDTRLRLSPEQTTYTLEVKNGGNPQQVALGGHDSVTGFINGDDGRVHALIKDRAGEVHSHALDEQHSQLQGGWNLSQVLVLDNQRGLQEITEPAPADRLNLDRSGLVGLVQGRIQRWDATPQAWKDTSVRDIERLQRGADSKAYVLKGGKLLKLDVSPEHKKIPFSASAALAQVPRSTTVAMGEEIEGLGDRVISAFAMVNDKQFTALDDQNRLTAHHKDRDPVELNLPGLDGAIQALALDEKHNLHALTQTGGLYRLPKEVWQAAQPAAESQARWTPVPTPGGQPLSNLYSNDDNALSAEVEGASRQGVVKLKGTEWHGFEPRPVEQNGLNDTFSRIFQTHKTRRIPGTGGTIKAELNVLGRAGMEKSNRASASEFISAHVFKSTGKTPRVLKNIGNHIQHRYHGREGLKPLYESQSVLFKRLELIHEAAPADAPGVDLKTRIKALNLGASGESLMKELEAFRDELEKHTYTALMDIGQGYGKFTNLRQSDGLLNVHGELAKSSTRTELGKSLADLKTRLNFKSSGHDLVSEFQNALTRIAPSAENRTGQLLQRLKDAGLKLSHQKADIPLGQRRDSSDDIGLSKARLALDMVTLHSVGKLLDKLELLTPAADTKALHKELETLRDTTYGKHPVKQVTEMGFTSHDKLETTYDAIKTFLKAFKKPDHAVSVNMRAATGSKDQIELAEKLKSMLKQLENGNDEISLLRSYGLNITSPFAMFANRTLGPWPLAAATGNRNYMLNAERGEDGIVLHLLREAVGSVSAGVGGGKDFWPGLFDENNPARHVGIGNDRQLTPNLRFGADLTATATGTQRVGVAFRVPDDAIDHFVDDLFEGKLNPLQVLNKAFDHEAQEARRFNFDLTAGVTAELRAGFDLSDKDSKPLAAIARLGVAANVNINLLTYTDYSLSENNDKTHMREGGKNRVQLGNNALAAVQGRMQLSVSHTDNTPPSKMAQQSAANNLGVTGSVTVDSKTTKRVKFRYQVAQPMTAQSLAKISDGLADAFKDTASHTKLKALADPLDPRYVGNDPDQAIQVQLEELQRIFADKPWQNDAQYKALRDLRRATVQQQASVNQHSVLDNARFESNATNLSRLDEQSIITSIISKVKELSNPSNASRVARFISEDPKLKALLKEMQASDGNLARVRLEPKDSLIDRIDEGSRDGTMTQGELAGLLDNRNNLRIKALTVYHTATQQGAFTSPTPLVSYNSTASLAVTKALGHIAFTYGADQDTPVGYTFDGELSRPSEALKAATGSLKEAGFELKS